MSEARELIEEVIVLIGPPIEGLFEEIKYRISTKKGRKE